MLLCLGHFYVFRVRAYLSARKGIQSGYSQPLRQSECLMRFYIIKRCKRLNNIWEESTVIFLFLFYLFFLSYLFHSHDFLLRSFLFASSLPESEVVFFLMNRWNIKRILYLSFSLFLFLFLSVSFSLLFLAFLPLLSLAALVFPYQFWQVILY